MKNELKTYAKNLSVLAVVAVVSLLFTSGYALAQDDTYNNVIFTREQ